MLKCQNQCNLTLFTQHNATSLCLLGPSSAPPSFQAELCPTKMMCTQRNFPKFFSCRECSDPCLFLPAPCIWTKRPQRTDAVDLRESGPGSCLPLSAHASLPGSPHLQTSSISLLQSPRARQPDSGSLSSPPGSSLSAFSETSTSPGTSSGGEPGGETGDQGMPGLH